MSEPTGQAPRPDVRLADFIRQNIESIVAEWISFARTRTPAGDNMTALALQDHVVEILGFIADDIETVQSDTQQVAKSRGLGPDDSPFTQTAAEIHATLRLADGFNIDQMVSEYRALRASVVKQWVAPNPALAATGLEDLTRFNEAIDQAMAESVANYTKMITHSRNVFLGILGHDLRNPMGAALMAAKGMAKAGTPGDRQTLRANQIVEATQRGLHILNDLLDMTRSAFGLEIPVTREAMDLSALAGRLVDEMSSVADGRTLKLVTDGDTHGQWDESRLGQVLSNLIGNALQYSPPASTVHVRVEGHEGHVRIIVQNSGDPIPPEKIRSVFEPLSRGNTGPDVAPGDHLGLGLFIAKKIVAAHGGKLTLTSTAREGTTFTAELPRQQT